MKDLLASKKFWIAVAGIIVMIVGNFTGIPEDQLMAICGIIISYILGQGIADHGKEAAKINGNK